MSAVPAGEGGQLPTRSEIESWPTQHLDDAASRWRTAAATGVRAFEQHYRNIVSPGGTEWTGAANDAAVDRVTGDLGVVRHHADVTTEAAHLAETGAEDIRAVKKLAVEAIVEATEDGFTVAEDLSVTDARRYDITTVADRNKAAKEHAEFIAFRAAQLVATDSLAGTRLESKAAQLQGITFQREGDGAHDPTVRMVDNKTTTAAGDTKDKPGEKPGEKPAEQATGQIGPFAVPKEVEDAAKRAGLKPPDGKAPDPTGLGELLGAGDPATAKPGEDKPGNGLPPVLSQLGTPIDRPMTPPKPAAAPRFDPNTPEGRAGIAAARQTLLHDGVPAAEVDQRLAAMTAQAQQPLPPPPMHELGPKPALPGLGEQLGDKFNNFINDAHDQFYNRLDSTVNTAQNLTGTGGDGHPGVADSWKELGQATLSHQLEDPLHLRDPMGTLGPIGALNSTVHDVPEMVEHPGKYFGDRLFDGAAAAPGAILPGEGALARGALESALTHSVEHGVERGAVAGVAHDPVPAVPHAPMDVPHNSDHGPIGHGGDTAPPTMEHHAPDIPRSAADILHETRDWHRAERDQMDWDRGEQNLHDLAAQHGVSVDQLPRTPQYDIDHPTYTDKHAADHSAEIDRHTQLWEHGFNTQSVQQVLDNMDAPRAPTTDLRSDLRQGLYDYGYDDLRESGYSAAEADRLSREYAEAQFPRDAGLIPQPVIHNPDGAIGGYPTPYTYGDWQVNNALGNLTKQEKDALRAWLLTQDPNAIVNIRLGRHDGG
ncbi:hypothetical protein OS121_19355 [Mycolicibacterium mucogenicum]|uniref:hypothetical protein n=1 Tax=Mycolicibacterium mucogenicum TaxID=56689 RepID=UPI002269EC9F|nr:hypothetical protein [Mycolicibacterium mucogenicum]MCX8557213.1 hypothetical protein [Mycolicibacterium mucogenicum]